jgi:hypothetical protein
VLLGAAKSKHLMEGLSQVLEWMLRLLRGYEILDDIDEAAHLDVGS